MSELIDLKAAIEQEIRERQQEECCNLAADLKAKMKEILSAGLSIIVEDSDDEVELIPTQAFSLEVTVYPTIQDSSSKAIR